MADEVKKLTGEERIDALCAFLAEKHGFLFPEDVFTPKQEEEEGVHEKEEQE